MRLLLSVVLGVMSAVVSVVVVVCTSQSAFASTRSSVVIDGRRSEVVVPSRGGRSRPIILLLHGYMGNASVMDTWFALSREVDSRGFVLILPEGLEDSMGQQYWNASSACCDFDHRGQDDISYLSKVVTQVSARFATDRSRLFVVGHSNGAFMAHRLACAAPIPVRAIVTFAGVLGPEECKPAQPVSVLQIHAVDDDTINYLGDTKGYQGLTGYRSAAATVATWVASDHCTGAPAALARANITTSIPGDDTTRVAYTGCTGGAHVEFWTIEPFNKSWFHMPHSPFLNDTFTPAILDFLFRS